MSISTLSPGSWLRMRSRTSDGLLDVVAVHADDDVAGLQAAVVGRGAGHDLGHEGALVDVDLEGRLDVVGHVGQLGRRDARNAWSGLTSPSPALSSSMIGLAWSMAIEKPRFWASATIAVFMPTTWPAALTSGPPELPGLMAASVWIRPSSCSPSAVRSRSLADTIPRVTVGSPAEVQRVADGDDLVADAQVVGRPELGRLEAVDALDLDDGDVVVGRRADQGGGVVAAVGQHHRDLADAADDVGVGEHQAVGA